VTLEEALALRSFDHYCTCGGFAAGTMNDRDPANPHMRWCPQKPQYDEWYAAIAAQRKEGA
jgi:hypothetical protein